MLDFEALARKHGTPLYVYDLNGLAKRAALIKQHLPSNGSVHYALKANNNKFVLDVLKKSGFGLDVVSAGELKWALRRGFSAKDIVFSGVGKTIDEITVAIKARIAQLNVESLPELERVAHLARRLKAKVSVAIRVNPDVDAETHPYIRTGFRDNKFGVDFSEVSDFLQIIKAHKDVLKLNGLALHIGSQIREVEPFYEAIRKTLGLYKSIQSLGHDLKVFDVGGGLGMNYMSSDPSDDEALIQKYFATVRELLENEVEKIFFEPGRILVARCGSLVSEIQYIKRTPHKNFVIVDAGMNHLIRPALYKAQHRIGPARENKGGGREMYDVVGPICESSDVLGAEVVMSDRLEQGELIVVHDTGAYGAVMSSDYNMRARAKEIAVDAKGRVFKERTK